jgi:hypothetical protein
LHDAKEVNVKRQEIERSEAAEFWIQGCAGRAEQKNG